MHIYVSGAPRVIRMGNVNVDMCMFSVRDETALVMIRGRELKGRQYV